MKNSRYYTRCITAGRAAEGLRADWQAQLREVQKEIGFDYIRFHGIFHDDMAIYHENDDGTCRYFFGYFDKLIDFLLSVNIRPILEFGFMPSQLATKLSTIFWWRANGAPPTDYDKWEHLIEATVRHATERYGTEEVKQWYFEVWNEPNLGSFWAGTQEEYFHLYETSVRAVKRVNSGYRVGGPSTSGADFRDDLHYLKEFLAFCEKKQLPVDFISAHPYPTYWPLDTAGVKHMGYMEQTATIQHLSNVHEIRNHSHYPQAEIHLTEWNSSPSPRDMVHDTPFMAPFLLYNISMNFNKVDSLGFWTFTDIFEENGPGEQPFHGGFGLINADNIKKPAYWAYEFLSQLGDEILFTSEDRIISKQGSDYIVLIWNFCYYKENFAKGERSALKLTDRDSIFDNQEHHLELNIDMGGKFYAEQEILNESTSALHNWILMGAPQYPSQRQVEELKRISTPKLIEENPACGIYQKSFDLKPHEVRLIRLKKATI